MTADPYRVLNVLPTADMVVIRAAYLALMKQHHPDQGGADGERAKEVSAAYRLLSDPQRRAAYDRGVAERQALGFNSERAMPPRPPRHTGRTAFFILSAATAGLFYVALNRPVTPVEQGGETRTASRVEAPAILPPALAEARPDVPQPPRVDRALEAAAEEEMDLAAADPLPAEDVTPAPAPRRPTQPRMAEAAPAPVSPAPRDEPRPVKAQAPVRDSAPVQQASAPAIDLKPLERHQTILYNQSFLAGDEARRARLMETRVTFLSRLESCTTDLCRRDVYLARNQEVAAIMQR